jgi:hypothetical protein
MTRERMRQFPDRSAGKEEDGRPRLDYFRTVDYGEAVDATLLALVAIIAVVIAGAMFAGYYANPDLLWRGLEHDRNGHFSFGLDLALAVRSFDPIWFFSNLETAKVWPPLHGLVLSLVLLIGGIDYRLAIVPSLIGWMMTIILTWLIGRRLFVGKLPGIAAAGIAVSLAIASPAFRLLGSDVMLEGLGSGLTALALWSYMRALAMPGEASRWWVLALTLTALFFQKGNYWGLTVASLLIAHVSTDWRPWWVRLRAAMSSVIWRRAAAEAVRDPLIIAFVVVVSVVVYVYWRGPTAIELFGRRVSLYPPENLVTVAYAILFLRAALAWRARRVDLHRAMGNGGRVLFYGHALPVTVSFLLPHRLSSFLWFVGPFNSGSAAGPTLHPWDGVILYWQALAEGYHVAPWMAALTLVLSMVALIGLRQITAGGRAAVILALVAGLAVLIHPQHQSRFLASWIFAIWLSAGAGGALVLSALTANFSGRVRATVTAAMILVFAAVNALHAPPATAYAHAIRRVTGPSDLELAAAYLPFVAGERSVGFAGTFETSKFFVWTTAYQCRCHVIDDHPWYFAGQSRQEVRRIALDWMTSTGAALMVVIDAPESSEQSSAIYDQMRGVLDATLDQDRFALIATETVPDLDAQVTIWRRKG